MPNLLLADQKHESNSDICFIISRIIRIENNATYAQRKSSKCDPINLISRQGIRKQYRHCLRRSNDDDGGRQRQFYLETGNQQHWVLDHVGAHVRALVCELDDAPYPITKRNCTPIHPGPAFIHRFHEYLRPRKLTIVDCSKLKVICLFRISPSHSA